ncbi:MAG: acyl-CoA dehydrogenase family protein [Ilumatobacteraceae bacterium]|nr:acyl-CoA dehydrogenase family protein [Ilumatobacteraceae bacterium]
MAIDFSVEPEFQANLDWIEQFVREEVEPIDALFPSQTLVFDKQNEETQGLIRPLQERVRERGLWAMHLPPSLGGMGLGNVSLALVNEILGRSPWASSVFGCQAPDSGNAEIIAHYGTDQQKDTYLAPLLDGLISSTYAMTEPQGGADPMNFTCTAVQDGDEWVINGQKWFASNFKYASFIIAMVITDPDVPVHRGASMILIPKPTQGMSLIRNVGLIHEEPGEGAHGYLQFDECRVPAENLLGDEGSGFKIAQTRLGGGRLHHAMRSVAVCRRALDMMGERIVSRRTKGAPLADQQAVRHSFADSWIQLEQFRLQVLHAAWQCDQNGYDKAREYVAGIKVATPKTVTDIAYRTLHGHGALGATNELPLGAMLQTGIMLGLADGPTEVHKDNLARKVLKGYRPSAGEFFPDMHLPTRRIAAREKYADLLEPQLANW